MSFYGLVLILTVLMLSFYLYAFLNEMNSAAWISVAYAKSAQTVFEEIRWSIIQNKV